MKKCPYCAELIQEEAIKCRYCGSDLTVPPSQGLGQRPGAGSLPRPTQPVPSSAEPPGAGPVVEPDPQSPAPAAPGVADGPQPAGPGAPFGPAIGEGALRYSHSGHRYILGYGKDDFGIWDRESPGGPVARFPRTDAGWAAAWNQFTAWEPRAMEVPQTAVPAGVRGATGTYRSASGLAKVVVALIAIVMVLGLADVIIWGSELGTLARYDRGTTPLTDVTRLRDAAGGVLGWTFLLVVPAAILWLIWQHRSHTNLRALGAANLQYSPGWAVGWWFVPFANVVMPYLTMRELWKASDPEAGSVDWMVRRATPILGLWWAARIIMQVLFQIGVFVGGSDLSSSGLRAEGWYFLLGDVVLIAWGVLAVLVVGEIGRRQAAKFDRVSAWATGFPST